MSLTDKEKDFVILSIVGKVSEQDACNFLIDKYCPFLKEWNIKLQRRDYNLSTELGHWNPSLKTICVNPKVANGCLISVTVHELTHAIVSYLYPTHSKEVRAVHKTDRDYNIAIHDDLFFEMAKKYFPDFTVESCSGVTFEEVTQSLREEKRKKDFNYIKNALDKRFYVNHLDMTEVEKELTDILCEYYLSFAPDPDKIIKKWVKKGIFKGIDYLGVKPVTEAKRLPEKYRIQPLDRVATFYNGDHNIEFLMGVDRDPLARALIFDLPNGEKAKRFYYKEISNAEYMARYILEN